MESKSKITYLGFDNDMSFSSMGNSVTKKGNDKLKFIYRNSALFGTNDRQLLCSALVNPYFEYACNTWCRIVNAKVKHELRTAQNKIGYLLNYGCRSHIGFSDFKKSNCLDINGRVDYVSLNLKFNIFNNVVPRVKCQGSKSVKLKGSRPLSFGMNFQRM